MPNKAIIFTNAATPIVDEQLALLRTLTFAQARTLPECEGRDCEIGGMKASLTVFRQENAYSLEGKTLVVVLAARPTMFGMGEQHIEKGLVFSDGEAVREATALELQNTGG